MDINQLQTLLHVSESGSLLAASRRLRIAQPALSRKVRQIEQELGSALFVRHGRGMTPTPFGELVIQRAQTIIDEISAIREDAQKFKGSPSEEISVGFPPNISEAIAIPVLRRFHAKHSNAKVRLVSAFSGHLQEWLVNGDVDVALTYEQDASYKVARRPLLHERLYFVGAGTRSLKLDQPYNFPDIQHEKLVLTSRQHRLRHIVEDAAEAVGVPLNVVHEADDLLSIRSVITSGFACSILSYPAVFAQVANGELSAAPLENPSLSRRLDFAFSVQRPLSALGKDLTKAIHTELDIFMQTMPSGTHEFEDSMSEAARTL